ncbi:lathosterol oxidase [Streptacidiphilus sp. MAP12-33]|uniref:sterol desaturase family protein n=1 Tax=Streptacidiphilus sp. MAP12-33 TaxID=3156266 RepID=UPI0035126348
MAGFLAGLRALPWGWFALLAVAVNVVQLMIAHLVTVVARSLPWSVVVPDPAGVVPAVPDVEAERRAQRRLAVSTVIGNSVVLLLGWWLWRRDVIGVDAGFGPAAVVDFVLLTLGMDVALYLGHVIAHLGRLFPLAHRLHHRFAYVGPLTLFAVHPLEVAGLGGVWLTVLALHRFAASAIVAFGVANLVFGALGHAGVDPLPASWRRSTVFRWIATPALHVGHHWFPERNFGFYTTLWDRLFGTLVAGYDEGRGAGAPAAAGAAPGAAAGPVAGPAERS